MEFTTVRKELLFQAINVIIIAIFFYFLSILPSIVNPQLPEPTQTGKFFILARFVLVLFSIFLISLLLRPIVIKLTWIDFFLIIFFGWMLLNRYYLQTTQGFSLRYYELIGLAIIYIVSRRLPLVADKYLLAALALGGLIQAIYGNLQLHGYIPVNNSRFPITGSFFNPGPYGGYLVCVLPAALGVIFSVQAKYIDSKILWVADSLFKIISMASVAMIALIIIPIQSRASWVALIIGTGYFFITSGSLSVLQTPKKQFIKKSVFYITLILSVIFMTVLYNFKKDSADGRLLIWETSFEMIADKPITGIGLDRFKAAYMGYQAAFLQNHPEYFASGLADNVEYAFNEPLQFVIEHGILAGIVAGCIIIMLFKSTLRNRDPITWGSIAGILTGLIFSLFSYPSAILPIKLTLLIYVVLIVKRKTSMLTLALNNPKITTMLKCLFIITWITISINVYIGINRLYNAFENWDIGKLHYDLGDSKESLLYLTRARQELKEEGAFLILYGKVELLTNHPYKALSTFKGANKFINNSILQMALGDAYSLTHVDRLAELSYKNAANMSPSKFYPYYKLANFFYKRGEIEKAKEISKSLLKKEVKVPSAAINEMLKEMKKLSQTKSNMCPDSVKNSRENAVINY